MEAPETAVGHDENDVSGTRLCRHLLHQRRDVPLCIRLEAAAAKRSHQLGDVQLLAFRDAVMPLGDAETHSGCAVEGRDIRGLVKLAAGGVASRLEDGPQTSPGKRPNRACTVSRTAVGWWAKSSMTATPSDFRPELLPTADAGEAGKARLGLGKGQPKCGDDGPGSHRVLHIVQAWDEELDVAQGLALLDKGEARPCRALLDVLGPHPGSGVPGPRAYRTRRQRAWLATSRARGQWALTAKKPSFGKSFTKLSKADW